MEDVLGPDTSWPSEDVTQDPGNNTPNVPTADVFITNISKKKSVANRRLEEEDGVEITYAVVTEVGSEDEVLANMGVDLADSSLALTSNSILAEALVEALGFNVNVNSLVNEVGVAGDDLDSLVQQANDFDFDPENIPEDPGTDPETDPETDPGAPIDDAGEDDAGLGGAALAGIAVGAIGGTVLVAGLVFAKMTGRLSGQGSGDEWGVSHSKGSSAFDVNNPISENTQIEDGIKDSDL